MELEIVEVGPLAASSVAGAAEAGTSGPPVAQQFDSEKLPQTLESEIRPFLRVANQIEAESPRVAYLCRFHAFEKAHIMDPRSAGRGVRQFKTALLQRLEQDNKSTFSTRKEKNDDREIESFYEKKKQVNAHELMPVLEVLKALLIGTGGASGRFADRGADERPLAPVWKISGPDSSYPAEIRRTAAGSCSGWRRLAGSKRNKAGGIPISLIRGTAMETAVRGEATRRRRTPDPVTATTGWSVAAAVQDNGDGIPR